MVNLYLSVIIWVIAARGAGRVSLDYVVVAALGDVLVFDL